MKILLTGAHGLLARHFIAASQDCSDLHATVHRPVDYTWSNVNLHQVDFSGTWSTDAFPDQIDAVIHLAQSSRYREFPDQAMDIHRVNTDATARLLDYAHRAGAGTFVFASTGGLYVGGPKPLTEDSAVLPLDRLNYHFASKLSGEALSRCYAQQMHVIILRPFFIYGTGQRRSMLIPRLVDSVRQGRPITLQGEEGLRINPVHVRDAVHLLQACLNRPATQTINLAGPEALSLKRIAQIIGQHLSTPPTFNQAPGEPVDLIADISRMRTLVDQPLIAFEQGVRDVC